MIRQKEILLVEDNPADVRLTQEAFKNSEIIKKIHVVYDGEEAMFFLKNKNEYINSPRPDLILLDLNLPKKNGKEVLREIKKDHHLKTIPVVILSTSASKEDIISSYSEHANCYITKPVDFDEFQNIIKSIESFWLNLVKLPGNL